MVPYLDEKKKMADMSVRVDRPFIILFKKRAPVRHIVLSVENDLNAAFYSYHNCSDEKVQLQSYDEAGFGGQLKKEMISFMIATQKKHVFTHAVTAARKNEMPHCQIERVFTVECSQNSNALLR